jgi:hypothetical protein
MYEQPGEKQNLPIARFGQISRMPKEPIIRRGDIWDSVDAYLVECRSWGGHSGGPVLLGTPHLSVR